MCRYEIKGFGQCWHSHHVPTPQNKLLWFFVSTLQFCGACLLNMLLQSRFLEIAIVAAGCWVLCGLCESGSDVELQHHGSQGLSSTKQAMQQKLQSKGKHSLTSTVQKNQHVFLRASSPVTLYRTGKMSNGAQQPCPMMYIWNPWG